MLGVGRKPNVNGIGLEQAGIDFTQSEGIKVDDHLRTTNKDVYAVGDCCSKFKFTHNCDLQARTVIYNSLLFQSINYRSLLLPFTTYTQPEIAHIGRREHELKSQGVAYVKHLKPYSTLDRAICDSEKGMVKLLVKQDSTEILGATIVGGPAGDMIS